MSAKSSQMKILPGFEEKYFAAVNSREGFISFFGEIFHNLSKLYIIKGGPGTGKSHLMREIAKAAEEHGYRVEYYYCSADDHSLDGIIIRGIEVGVIDGTAPHTRDPEMAGALEDILNVGAFWDSEKLRGQLDEIRILTEKKSQLYTSVYDLLAASGRVEASARAVSCRALDNEKMTAAAERMLRGIKGNKESSEELRILSCIGMNGEVRFHTFEHMAKHRVLVRNTAGCGYLFLRALRRVAAKQGLHLTVSYSPLDPELEDGLYIHESDTACIFEEHAEEIREGERIINMARFLDGDYLREHRAKLRFLHRSAAEIKKEAILCFSEIQNTHFALEKIYSAAMDFEAKEAFTTDLIAKIFH